VVCCPDANAATDATTAKAAINPLIFFNVNLLADACDCGRPLRPGPRIPRSHQPVKRSYM
jgi:hypothetical protein